MICKILWKQQIIINTIVIYVTTTKRNDTFKQRLNKSKIKTCLALGAVARHVNI